MVDKLLDDIEKKVQQYEQLADTEKIQGGYDFLKEQINNLSNELEEINLIVDNPDNYYSKLEEDSMSELSDVSTFELYLDRIKQISNKMDDKSLTIDECAKLYIELHMITEWCNEYFAKQPLEVVIEK